MRDLRLLLIERVFSHDCHTYSPSQAESDLIGKDQVHTIFSKSKKARRPSLGVDVVRTNLPNSRHVAKLTCWMQQRAQVKSVLITERDWNELQNLELFREPQVRDMEWGDLTYLASFVVTPPPRK